MPIYDVDGNRIQRGQFVRIPHYKHGPADIEAEYLYMLRGKAVVRPRNSTGLYWVVDPYDVVVAAHPRKGTRGVRAHVRRRAFVVTGGGATPLRFTNRGDAEFFNHIRRDRGVDSRVEEVS